jgi:3-oxoacyl-[acyl-carrier-protein] synthase II
MKRIVITGMGALTPIGNDVATFWQNLIAGKSGASKITGFDTDDMPHNIACEVKGFDPPSTWSTKPRGACTVRRSLRWPWRGRRWTTPADRRRQQWERVGVLMATGGGGITEIEAARSMWCSKGWRSVGPFVVPSAMANAVSCIISIETGARGR